MNIDKIFDMDIEVDRKLLGNDGSNKGVIGKNYTKTKRDNMIKTALQFKNVGLEVERDDYIRIKSCIYQQSLDIEMTLFGRVQYVEEYGITLRLIPSNTSEYFFSCGNLSSVNSQPICIYPGKLIWIQSYRSVSTLPGMDGMSFESSIIKRIGNVPYPYPVRIDDSLNCAEFRLELHAVLKFPMTDPSSTISLRDFLESEKKTFDRVLNRMINIGVKNLYLFGPFVADAFSRTTAPYDNRKLHAATINILKHLKSHTINESCKMYIIPHKSESFLREYELDHKHPYKLNKNNVEVGRKKIVLCRNPCYIDSDFGCTFTLTNTDNTKDMCDDSVRNQTWRDLPLDNMKVFGNKNSTEIYEKALLINEMVMENSLAPTSHEGTEETNEPVTLSSLPNIIVASNDCGGFSFDVNTIDTCTVLNVSPFYKDECFPLISTHLPDSFAIEWIKDV